MMAFLLLLEVRLGMQVGRVPSFSNPLQLLANLQLSSDKEVQ